MQGTQGTQGTPGNTKGNQGTQGIQGTSGKTTTTATTQPTTTVTTQPTTTVTTQQAPIAASQPIPVVEPQPTPVVQPQPTPVINPIQTPVVSQQTTSPFNPGQDYFIATSIDTSKVLDISQSVATKGQMLIWTYHGGPNQKYKIRDAGNGKFKIESNLGGVLHVPDESSENFIRLESIQPTDATTEYFQIVPSTIQNGGYNIFTSCGKVVDVTKSINQLGTPVIQFDFHGGKNQVWYIKAA